MPRKIAPLVASDQKYCFSCQTIKPRTGFYRAGKTKPDGLTSQCKECVKAAQVARKETKARLEATLRFFQSRKSSACLIDLVGLDVEMAA